MHIVCPWLFPGVVNSVESSVELSLFLSILLFAIAFAKFLLCIAIAFCFPFAVWFYTFSGGSPLVFLSISVPMPGLRDVHLNPLSPDSAKWHILA